MQHPIVDVDTLCGNMDEVCQLSNRLLCLLELATKDKSFDEQMIGQYDVYIVLLTP